MSNEKHVLFNMDAELSQNLDEMIIDMINAQNGHPKRKELAELDGKPYNRSLRIMQDRIAEMADPDVAEIAPVLIAIFEKKKRRIEESDIYRETRDEIPYALSVQRKRMGIDSRKFKKADDSSTQRIEIAH